MNSSLIIVFGVIFTFLMTCLGAGFVFVLKNNISQKTNAIFSGFSGGVMISASIWSLLLPAINQSKEVFSGPSFLPASIGFFAGSAFMIFIDFLSEKLRKTPISVSEKKSKKLMLAVTIHNIPEGLAVGFALGVAMVSKTDLSWVSAFGLALGIGIQNIPEGTAVALPVLQSTHSKKKAFLAGSMSGVVEPIFAVIGFFLASFLTILQPWLLAFSAGAMIFVTIEELVPDAKLDSSHIGLWFFIVGFVLMMILDVSLG